MHEKPKSPWYVEPGSEREQLEYQREALVGVRANLKEFARQNDIVYEYEETDKNAFEVHVDPENRERVRERIKELVELANELPGAQEQSHRLDWEDRGEIFVISVKKA